MAWGAVGLIAGAYVLHAKIIGGPSALLLFGLSIACLYYAFMLKPVWAARVLYNRAGFTAHGDELLAKSRRDKRQLSIAVFDCADLLEVRAIYGSGIAHDLMERITSSLMRLSDRGMAARTGPAEFTVVLPGMDRKKALAAIRRVLGSPTRIELDAGDTEIVLVPEFLVECVGPDAASVDEIYEELRRELVQIGEREQRRQHCLQRERERHSRPMALVSAPLALN